MVQIKLSVLFILASAAITPVIALPVPTWGVKKLFKGSGKPSTSTFDGNRMVRVSVFI